MILNTKTIKLDINKKMFETITAKQGDTKSRFILFNLYDGPIQFDLTGRTVRVYGEKKDNTTIFNDLVITDAKKGYCTLELTNQMLAVEGMNELELVIFEGEKRLSTMPFILNVIGSKYSEDAIVSTNEFTALMNALKTVGDIDNKAEKKEVEKLSEQLDNITFIPKRLSVENDYTNALKRCIDLLDYDNGGIITIPQGATINFTEIEITKKNVKILGGGRLKGKIILNSSDDQQFNFSIENVILSNTIPIEVKKGRRFKINNCVFENCDKAIYINPSADASFHSIAMANISHNEFIEVNYALYGEKYSGAIDLQVNDFIFADNTINKAYYSHIYLKEIDGIVIHNNTMFFPSYDQLNNTKEYNIFIGSGDWIVISGNNLFESGYESILLENCKHPNISDNNVAWCGQRVPSSAIKLKSSNNLESCFKITDNNISLSSLHGIEIEKCKYGDIKDNVISISLKNNPFYYGTTDLSTLTHLGTYIITDLPISSLKINVDNNNLNVNSCNLANYIHFDPLKIDIKTNDTIINCDGYKQINLIQPSKTLITNFTGAYNGYRLLIMAFNSNSTLVYDSNVMLLKDGINATIPNGATIELEYYAGKWYELSRSFDTPYYYKYKCQDITESQTYLDASNIENFNLLQPSASEINSIDGGVNGKEITVIAFNNNTTINHSDALRLKGGINVSIPYNGIMKFRYYAGSWYEVSRSF